MITITLPVYNAMPYLPDAVESILGQSYSDFEFLIVDDGSTDSSMEYLSSLNDPRIDLKSRANMGLGYTLNELCFGARYDLIARMDADDISAPNRMLKQVEFLKNNPSVSAVGSGFDFLFEGSRFKYKSPAVCHEKILERFIQGRAGMCHPSMMFRKSSFEKIGGYRIRGAGEDVDFCLRLAEVGKLANIPENLLSYRLGENSLSQNKASELARGYAYALLCYKQRKSEGEEVKFEDFCKQWEGRKFHDRFSNFIDILSDKYYRKSLICYGSGNYLSSRYFLFLAALGRPRAVFNRLLGE